MAKRKTPRYPLVEIDWTDAWHENESPIRVSLLEALRLAERHTSGYLVYSDKDKLIVASDIDYHEADEVPDPEVDCYWCIPRGWVSNIRYRTRRSRARA